MSYNSSKRSRTHTIIWKIENFSMYSPIGDSCELVSPDYILDLFSDIRVRLICYPTSDYEARYMGLFLMRVHEDDGPRNVHVGYEFCVVTSDATEVFKLKNSIYMYKGSLIGSYKFASRTDLMADRALYLPRDTLTLRCKLWRLLPNNLSGVYSASRSLVAIQKMTLHWDIPDFVNSTGTPWRIVRNMRHNLFEMRAYLDAEDKSVVSVEQDIIRIEMKRIAKGPHPFYLKSKISVIDEDMSQWYWTDGEHLFVVVNEVWQHPVDIERYKLLKTSHRFLPNGVLTLQCEFTMADDVNPFHIPDKLMAPPPRPKKGTELLEDLNLVCRKEVFCNVLLAIGGQAFPCQQWLLSVRSNVLRKAIKSMVHMAQSVVKSEVNEDISVVDISENNKDETSPISKSLKKNSKSQGDDASRDKTSKNGSQGDKTVLKTNTSMGLQGDKKDTSMGSKRMMDTSTDPPVKDNRVTNMDTSIGVQNDDETDVSQIVTSTPNDGNAIAAMDTSKNYLLGGSIQTEAMEVKSGITQSKDKLIEKDKSKTEASKSPLKGPFITQRGLVAVRTGPNRFERMRVDIYGILYRTDAQCVNIAGPNILHLIGFDITTIENLLQYIYQELVNQHMNFEDTVKLYVAADKLDVQPLKRRCVHILSDNLAMSNVYETLVFADRYKEEGLKTSACELLFANMEYALTSTEWQKFLEEEESLSNEIVLFLRMKRGRQPDEHAQAVVKLSKKSLNFVNSHQSEEYSEVQEIFSSSFNNIQ